MASVTTTRPRSSTGGFDPFRALFRLFTSVRFALLQLAVVAIAALLGVIFPQAPDPVRLNPPAFSAWLELQHARYGVFTGPMRRAELFQVFHSVWFNGLFFVLIASVTVCTVNRFSPIWRTVRRPIRRVNDRYFETAHARAAFPTPVDGEAIARVLRRKRYKVEAVAERDGARYLFADRYAWGQMATFASHLSLILFMAGGIVTKLVGFSAFIEVGEGATQPVFPVEHPNQMQVLNLDSIEGRDDQGHITDYRTKAVIYQNGVERCRGDITVNNPLRCNGYTFHQATYTANGVALQVKERASGQVVYAEAPILSDQAPAPRPRLVARDAAGAVVLDEFITMAPVTQETLAQVAPMPDSGRLFVLSGALTGVGKDWKLGIFPVPRAGDANSAPAKQELSVGESVVISGYTLQFAELATNSLDVVQGIPGMERAALVQLATDRQGEQYLDIVNMADQQGENGRFQLEPGQPVVAGDYEYTFQGRREYTGVLVKRDPGSWFIWTATTLLMAGLILTFYLPRRRLWVKITAERTVLAGIAERTAHLGEELAALGEEMRKEGGAARPPQTLRPVV